MHKAYGHVLHEGNGCEWVDAGWKLVRVGGIGLKMSENGLKWVEVGGSGWKWLGARFSITHLNTLFESK